MATPAVMPSFSDSDRAELAQEADALIQRLRRHGRGEDGSVTRLVYTAAWQGAMAEIEDWFRAAGLPVRSDAVGSRFGRLSGDSPEVVLSGSHIDSVVRGGAYDGVLGVVIAGCAVHWLAATFGRPKRTIEVLANCEEESSRFSCNFWGGRAMTGRILEGESDRLTDPEGVSIGSAMRACGLDPERIPEAERADLVAFVEPHIEQGPVLATAGDVIGVVDQGVGVRGLSISLQGAAGHAGTIPMARRRDALTGAAEVVLGAERIAKEQGAPAVATVGHLTVEPGGFNQVPGSADFTIDFRHPNEAALDRFEASLLRMLEKVASGRELEARTRPLIGQPGIRFDDHVCACLETACQEAGVAWRRMPSHAGHDAQLLGSICPAAMLFVPSQGGHSHRPDEYTEVAHIGYGIEVLARTLFRLAYQD